MQKRRPLYGSISAGLYEITDKTNVLVEDFSNALKRLAEDHLRGAVSLNITGTSYGYIDISISTVAEIVKLMLAEMAPDDVLGINILVDSNFEMELAPHSLPEVRQLAKIITFAKSAGFTVSRTKSSIILTSSITNTHIISVYAISQEDIYDELYSIISS